jgi:dTDP-glucose pyrophosphorylase/CBS domain-containing protein
MAQDLRDDGSVVNPQSGGRIMSEPCRTRPALFVDEDTPLREVLACINAGARGIALVVDPEGRLIDTVTDGDIRRAILADVALDAPARQVFPHKKRSVYPEPVTAAASSSVGDLRHLMDRHAVRQVPLLDSDRRVVGLATYDDVVPDTGPLIEGVVMAGGFGKRLRPFTDDTPKPMLPVGDKPMLQHILEQMRCAGISQVHVTTHYKPEVIESYFGDGHDFGVSIRYVNEDRPLGTAGALGLLDTDETPLLVMNGDILTRLDLRAMLRFHCENSADLTMALREHRTQIPYGVVDTEGPLVVGLREKPVHRCLVNAGVYLLNPGVRALVPRGRRLDMTDLIEHLLERGMQVVGFPVLEYWLDIGRHPDYRQAQEDMLRGLGSAAAPVDEAVAAAAAS